MSHSRIDDIYDELSSLYRLRESFDGSRTFGLITPEMDLEWHKISAQIGELEAEQESLRRK